MRGPTIGSSPWRGWWAVAGHGAAARKGGGGSLGRRRRRRKGREGRGPGWPIGPARWDGPEGHWAEGQENKIRFPGLEKLIKKNLMAETIGKNSQKIVENLGMQDCELG
jgi:hypothetical protein